MYFLDGTIVTQDGADYVWCYTGKGFDFGFTLTIGYLSGEVRVAVLSTVNDGILRK